MNELVDIWKSKPIPEGPFVMRKSLPADVKVKITGLLASLPYTDPDCAYNGLMGEANENASLKPVEGLHSVGAGWGQRMWLGVIPQVAPNYLSYALLRFEINIRASAILGFVGSGGIGYDLKNAFSWGQGRYDEVAAIFLLLFGAIVFFDQISSRYRNKRIAGN